MCLGLSRRAWRMACFPPDVNAQIGDSWWGLPAGMTVHPSPALSGSYAASFLHCLRGVASLACTLPCGQDVQVIEERQESPGRMECGRGLAPSGMLAEGEKRRRQRINLFAPFSLGHIAALPRLVPPAVCGRTAIEKPHERKELGRGGLERSQKRGA